MDHVYRVFPLRRVLLRRALQSCCNYRGLLPAHHVVAGFHVSRALALFFSCSFFPVVFFVCSFTCLCVREGCISVLKYFCTAQALLWLARLFEKTQTLQRGDCLCTHAHKNAVVFSSVLRTPAVTAYTHAQASEFGLYATYEEATQFTGKFLRGE